MTPIRVVVVEDEPLARAGIIALLHADPEFIVVGEADAASPGRRQRPARASSTGWS